MVSNNVSQVISREHDSHEEAHTCNFVPDDLLMFLSLFILLDSLGIIGLQTSDAKDE